MKNENGKAAQMLIFLCLFCCCTNKKHQTEKVQQHRQKAAYRKINFTIVIQEHTNDSLDFYEGLLFDKRFVGILEHSELYFNDELSFLNHRNLNAGQVAISICGMQTLGVHDYVKLCATIFNLYNAKKLPVTILEHAIAPDFLRKRIIIDNYENPEVVSLLKSIQKSKTITDQNFLKRLPDILSGKSSKELKDFDKENGDK